MKSPVYICYDAKQKKFLVDNGLRYWVCGLNPNCKDHRMFWVFMRDEKLDKLLIEWNK